MKDKYKLKEELTRYRGRICAAKMQYNKDCTLAMLTYNTRFVDRACCEDHRCLYSFDNGSYCMKSPYAGEMFTQKVR